MRYVFTKWPRTYRYRRRATSAADLGAATLVMIPFNADDNITSNFDVNLP